MIKCEYCKTNKAVMLCMPCDKPLCLKCLLGHIRGGSRICSKYSNIAQYDRSGGRGRAGVKPKR